jgi:hypothetical protein
MAGIWALAAVISLAAVTPARQGEMVLHATFDRPDALAAWQASAGGRAALVEGGDRHPSKVLAVESPSAAGKVLRLPLPVQRLRGMRLTLSAMVRAEHVAKPPAEWNGVKLMLITESPTGPTYTSPTGIYGTFDWRPLSINAPVPQDATGAAILIGIEKTTGKAWFDDVTVTVSAVPRQRPTTRPATLPTEQLDRRTPLPRLRGVMYGPHGKEADLRVLASWHANLIRWQLYWYEGSQPNHKPNLAEYDRWLNATLDEIDHFLPLCHQLGLNVLIDLHTPPGGTVDRQMRLFMDKRFQDHFLKLWDRIATRFKDRPALWGYDLLNEPIEGRVSSGLRDWPALAEQAAQRIRQIDPKHAIIFEPGPWGGWDNLQFLTPLKVPGLIYSVHMYEPLALTHQGVMPDLPRGVSYPGQIDGRLWNKQILRQVLQPVREFQLDYGVPIYIGEFSIARWAPGDSAPNYLRDCIELFEEYGWDWSYHAFREWQGWNVELGSNPDDKTPATQPTARQRLLMFYFYKNKPAPHPEKNTTRRCPLSPSAQGTAFS